MKFWGFTFGIAALLILVINGLAYPPGQERPATVARPAAASLPDLLITCDQDSFHFICDRYAEDIYVIATVQIGQRIWKKVRLRVRGDTSRTFPKKSLKLKFPEGDDLPFGRDDLNLNAEYLDKTYMRQYLSTRVFQASGQPCYNSQHVMVHLNGKFMGIYLLVQNVDKDFLTQWGMSKKGDLFKATKDHACLNWRDDVRKYWERKGPKDDTTWTPLAQLIKMLNDTPDSTYARMCHAQLDYKNMINTIAVNMLIGNRSTYYHNYFMYRSPTKQQWHYLPWDMDKTFLREEATDEYMRCNLSDSKLATMESNPFFERALVIPSILKDIQRRIDTLTATVFNAKYLFPILDSLGSVLGPLMEGDTAFRRQTMASWGKEIAEVKDYIVQRPMMLANQFSHSPTSFQLVQPKGPLVGDRSLRWHAAHDPDGDRLTYHLSFSPDPKFPSSQLNAYMGLQDTTFVLPPTILPGKYYWKVVVNDGIFDVRAFDNVATFEIVKP